MISLRNRFAALDVPENGVLAGPIATNTNIEVDTTFGMDKILTKCFFKYIQVTHHYEIIQTALANDNFPRGMMRQVDKLTQFIKPACPLGQTTQRVKENTQNWMSINMQILQEHYSMVMEDLLTCIHALKEREWEVACRWAKTRFRQKLREDTIQKARRNIKEVLDGRQLLKIGAQDRVICENEDSILMPISDLLELPVVPARQSEEHLQEGPLGTLLPEGDDLCSAKAMRVQAQINSHIENDSSKKVLIPTSPHRERRQTRGNGCVQMLDDISPVSLSPEASKRYPSRVCEMMNGSQQRKDSIIRAHTEPSLNPSNLVAPRTPETVEMTEHAPMEQTTLTIGEQGGSRDQDLNLNMTRHPNTSRKMLTWQMSVKKPIILMGDSNLSRIPYMVNSQVQVDSFPGAKFLHVANVLQKLTPNLQVQKVVLSVGINNREQ
ncbi:MAG: hypothetical protein ACRC7D_10460, partial [Aeromonas popoffii]|uniref:hypothetical protein n=1 Tax=Aeromonas popoffii TaxID=70856 RepID=UPI003F2D426D